MIGSITHSRASGLAGVEKIFPLDQMNEYEAEGLKACIAELKDSIQKGVDFANK